MNTITLNNVTFKISKKALNIHTDRYKWRGLYDCYRKASYKKDEIWKEWVDYFCNLSINMEVYAHPFINSYNSNFFTIGCEFTKDNICYHILITPTYNYIYTTNI